MRTPIPNEQFEKLIWEFDTRLFRLETLDCYAVPSDDEVYSAFLAGDLSPPFPQSWRNWFDRIKSSTDSGKQIDRVHVVPSVLSSYLRYEIEWAYSYFNQPFGENVYILVRDNNLEIATNPRSQEDYYILDDKRVLFVNYDNQNRWVGLELLTDPQYVSPYVDFRDQILQQALPLKDFLRLIRSSPLVLNP